MACGGDDDDDSAARGDDGGTSTTSTTTADGTSSSEPGTATTADPDEPVSSDDPTTTTSTSGVPPGAAGPCVVIDGDLSVELCQIGAATAETDTVIRVRASDDDAQVRNDCGSPYVDWGDGGDTAVCEIGCVPAAAPSEPSSIDETFEHRYEARGTYDVRVTVESNCGEPPTGARETVVLQIRVV